MNVSILSFELDPFEDMLLYDPLQKVPKEIKILCNTFYRVAEVASVDTPETLINRADGTLYQVKQEKRNRAILAAALPLERSGGSGED